MGEIVDYSTSAGSNNAASPNGMPEGMNASGVNNAWREHAARHKRDWSDKDGSVTTGGSSTAYTVTLNKGTTTLADIGPFTVELHTATGSGPTIAVNGGTAKNAAWADGTNLTTNDIAANTRVTFLYDADKDKFVVMSLATKPVLLAQTNTFTADQTITSTDAGQFGPTLKFYHNSASPAASDGVGYVTFNGKDGAGNETTYAKVFGEIVDTTDTSEDGRLAVQTVIAGSLASRAYIGAGIYTPNATGGDKGADSGNFGSLYVNDVPVLTAANTLGTAVATTSGTSAGFTGLPSGIKRIILMFNEVSKNGTDNILVQLSTGTTFATSGYVSVGCGLANAGTSVISPTSGFGIATSNANDVVSGHMILTHVGSNLWISSHSGKRIGSPAAGLAGGGSVTLGGVLDGVRIVLSGSDNFDNGSINILYD